MTYRTAQIAKLVGVHPNTIRFYEEMELIPVIPREENGYRIFTERHLKQLLLLRTAFKAEIISNRLRQEVLEIVKRAAAGEMDTAYEKTQRYLQHLRGEKDKAEEAIKIVYDIVEGRIGTDTDAVILGGRFEMSQMIGVTVDVLRDWERNGLIKVPRNSRGHRNYGAKEMKRLKIIHILRNAHYSMMSILRMLNRMEQGELNIRKVLDTPEEEEDIVRAADRYLTALNMAQKDALEMLELIQSLQYTTS